MTRIFNFSHKDSLGKYLGCLVFKETLLKQPFRKQLANLPVNQRVAIASCLSRAERTILIQSQLESLPAHIMRCLQLPQQEKDRTLTDISTKFSSYWRKRTTVINFLTKFYLSKHHWSKMPFWLPGIDIPSNLTLMDHFDELPIPQNNFDRNFDGLTIHQR